MGLPTGSHPCPLVTRHATRLQRECHHERLAPALPPHRQPACEGVGFLTFDPCPRQTQPDVSYSGDAFMASPLTAGTELSALPCVQG